MSSILILCTRHHAPFTYILYEKRYQDRVGYAVAICREGKQLVCAEDITHCKASAERFFDLISRGGLHPCHLYDVLEDMLPLH